jgi:Mrp family chromosome partitioning ATPase
MQAILERLAAAADLVIVDSPPLQAVTDAAILASITDGTLLVINAGHTRRDAAGRGREALAKSGARVLGATLNRLSQRGHGDYVYYDYYGAYGAEAQAKRGSKNAKPAPQGASSPTPLADRRG